MNVPGTALHRFDLSDGAPVELAKVRTWLRGLLHDVLPGTVDDAGLVLTELVTNAVEHAGEVLAIRAFRSDAGRVLRLEIDDPAGLGLRSAPDPDGRRGRGLILVDAVCFEWGVIPGPSGKTIWAELATPAA